MKLKILAFVLALAGQTATAQAAIMEMIYGGTVRNTVDYTGFFGAGVGGGVLDGKSFTARFVYDTLTGLTQTTLSRTDLYGGTAYSAASPFVSGVMTINGISIDLLVKERFIGTHTSGPSGSSAYVLAEKLGVTRSPVHSFVDITVNAAAGGVPLGFATPFSVTPLTSTGSFSTFEGNPQGGFLYRADGQITVSSLVVREVAVSAVPVPASGLMMLGLLGGIAALRRRWGGRAGGKAGAA